MAKKTNLLKEYYLLTKPGIIRGNMLIAVAGYLFASKWHIDPAVFIAMTLSLALIIASGCVVNNYIDRSIDKVMDRTKNRALVTGAISGRAAITYGATLGVVGALLLGIFTNWVTLVVALLGWFFYVVIYGIGKRKTVYGTVIGSISGAVPPVVGYTAASRHIDLGAVILFFTIVMWQMPHFYAIAMYRFRDYKAAGLPVLPVVKGMRAAKIQSIIFMVAFLFAIVALTAFDYAGYMYLIAELTLGFIWLIRAIWGFNRWSDNKWGLRTFLFSLVIITSLSITISLGSVLP